MVYYIYGPKGKMVFDLDGRLQEILSGHNFHPHHNNGANHGGMGAPNNFGTFAMPHQQNAGHAVYQLPPNGHGYYTEYVWNRPGNLAGVKRLIVGNGGELYVTTDHYHVYYKVYGEAKGSQTTFYDDKTVTKRSNGSTYTKFY